MPFLFALTASLKRIRQKCVGSRVDLFLVLWVVLIIIFFSRPESKIVGYILPVVPALALLLRARIQPGDLVVTYEKYYQDLGIYLASSDYITVVSDWHDPEITKSDNWRSEFYRGFADTEGEERWMLDKPGFAQRLAAAGTVYIFTAPGYAQRLEGEFQLQPIAEANGIMFLTNRPAGSAKGP